MKAWTTSTFVPNGPDTQESTSMAFAFVVAAPTAPDGNFQAVESKVTGCIPFPSCMRLMVREAVLVANPGRLLVGAPIGRVRKVFVVTRRLATTMVLTPGADMRLRVTLVPPRYVAL